MRGTAEEGYLHCGPAGAGHFVKMIHNGSNTDHGGLCRGIQHPAPWERGKAGLAVDAETTPLSHPEHFQYDLNLPTSPNYGGGAASSLLAAGPDRHGFDRESRPVPIFPGPFGFRRRKMDDPHGGGERNPRTGPEYGPLSTLGLTGRG